MEVRNVITLNQLKCVYCHFILSVKPGQPTLEELEELSLEVMDKWEKVARRLGFKEPQICAFRMQNKDLSEQAYKMLLAWKQKQGVAGSYEALYDALCHRLVGCNDLAQRFCCIVSVDQ